MRFYKEKLLRIFLKFFRTLDHGALQKMSSFYLIECHIL